uniref:Aminopeptidase n=1 Tax=Amphiprion percula TaxID=161767 RepID=A0A3P8SHJ5_AMPPE
MVDSMDLEKEQKQYCIRSKHVVIICVTVVVCSLAVGLGVGLSGSDCCPIPTSSTPEPTPQPTPMPTQPLPPSRGPCTPSTDSSGDWRNFRLPSYVNPVHYNLHLEPDLVDDTYSGTVEIQVEVSKPTRHLWLHIRETFVSTMPRLKMLNSQGGQRDVAVKSCFEYKPQQYVVVEATEELPVTGPGDLYVLSLDFQGWLNGSVVGFYRVIYTEKGVTKKIAATDHEPTDARKSFPCFDEPNKKATYSISITHDAKYGALSNMPPEGAPQQLPGNKAKTSFQKSIPMSTYLVCFAVHQFEYVERTSVRGIPLRIYAQPTQLGTAEYAANVTKIIFDYFEEYFNMTYSISKLDKIAIPDFGTGAMENWGLITYRETNLLYDENQSSSKNKQRVASVIAHELVHQWFGNIVTMDWWDDLWLTRGFASFFEYIGGGENIMIVNDVLPVMVDDALLSSHPIIVNVSTPAEITSVFDVISYQAASILRMLEDWIGRDMFRDGCRVSQANSFLTHIYNDEFDAADRTSYFDDVFALARAGIVDYGNALNLTKYLTNESDYIVWNRVASSIAYVQDMLSGNAELYPKFQVSRNFRDHVKAISTQLGWNDVGTQTQRYTKQETVLSIACQMGDQDALSQASHIFDQWIKGDLSSVAVNLRLLWNTMFQRYKNASLAQEKTKRINFLMPNRLLEATKDESVVRSQDLFTLVRYVSYNPLGQRMAWDWTTLNWDYLVNRYTINDRNLGRLLTQITTTYNTEFQLWTMEHFFNLTPDAGAGEMPRKQALETVRNNIEWIRRNENEIREWLENNTA